MDGAGLILPPPLPRPAIYEAAAEWPGETVVVFGAGPSLERTDLGPLFSARPMPRTVVINTAWRYWPAADVLFSGDRFFFRDNPDLSGYRGPLIVCCHGRAWDDGWVRDARAVWMGHLSERFGVTGLAPHRGWVSGRYTSVAQSMSFLAHRGVAKVVLLGVDMQPGPDGRRRAGLPAMDTADAAGRYQRMRDNLAALAPEIEARGIRVVNASPGSALDVWPRMTLAEALAC